VKETSSLNELEENARAKLVGLCQAMLAGQLSYFEGAVEVCQLRRQIRVDDFDKDIMAFVLISSETDHLPVERVRHRWSAEALQMLKPEFALTEEWAAPFASAACRHLVQRFGAQLTVPFDVPADASRHQGPE